MEAAAAGVGAPSSDLKEDEQLAEAKTEHRGPTSEMFTTEQRNSTTRTSQKTRRDEAAALAIQKQPLLRATANEEPVDH